jgi:hypothetical protein
MRCALPTCPVGAAINLATLIELQAGAKVAQAISTASSKVPRRRQQQRFIAPVADGFARQGRPGLHDAGTEEEPVAPVRCADSTVSALSSTASCWYSGLETGMPRSRRYRDRLDREEKLLAVGLRPSISRSARHEPGWRTCRGDRRRRAGRVCTIEAESWRAAPKIKVLGSRA